MLWKEEKTMCYSVMTSFWPTQKSSIVLNVNSTKRMVDAHDCMPFPVCRNLVNCCMNKVNTIDMLYNQVIYQQKNDFFCCTAKCSVKCFS